jgi:hypothetical protein
LVHSAIQKLDRALKYHWSGFRGPQKFVLDLDLLLQHLDAAQESGDINTTILLIELIQDVIDASNYYLSWDGVERLWEDEQF